MRRALAVAALALLAVGLCAMIVISLVTREVHGRWGAVVRLEAAPFRYWSAIVLLLAMVVLLIFAVRRAWQDM